MNKSKIKKNVESGLKGVWIYRGGDNLRWIKDDKTLVIKDPNNDSQGLFCEVTYITNSGKENEIKNSKEVSNYDELIKVLEELMSPKTFSL